MVSLRTTFKFVYETYKLLPPLQIRILGTMGDQPCAPPRVGTKDIGNGTETTSMISEETPASESIGGSDGGDLSMAMVAMTFS